MPLDQSQLLGYLNKLSASKAAGTPPPDPKETLAPAAPAEPVDAPDAAEAPEGAPPSLDAPEAAPAVPAEAPATLSAADLRALRRQRAEVARLGAEASSARTVLDGYTATYAKAQEAGIVPKQEGPSEAALLERIAKGLPADHAVRALPAFEHAVLAAVRQSRDPITGQYTVTMQEAAAKLAGLLAKPAEQPKPAAKLKAATAAKAAVPAPAPPDPKKDFTTRFVAAHRGSK